jgi:hypothetical protein
VDEQTERRLARNEVLFRQVNEAIARGLWPGEEQSVGRFRCECATLNCNETIELSAAAYEAVRQAPRRFVVLPGHELSEIEDVVEDAGNYLVVEKREAAGAEAASRDPST